MTEISVTGWIIAVLAAFAVGLAKGGLSMVGTISVPMMALFMSPVQAAGILLPVYILSDIGGLVAFRKHFAKRTLVNLLPGAICGIVLGWATAAYVSESVVELLVGLVGLSFALNALRPRRGEPAARKPDPIRGSIWGTVSGYTSFVAHAGAAPYQVYAQPLKMSPTIYAGTTTIFFAICNWVKVIPYALLGQLSVENLKVAGILMLPALLGVICGLWVIKRLSPVIFYRLITWMLLAVSLRLIWVNL